MISASTGGAGGAAGAQDATSDTANTATMTIPAIFAHFEVAITLLSSFCYWMCIAGCYPRFLVLVLDSPPFPFPVCYSLTSNRKPRNLQ
jgi:hypothetical protein